MNMKSILQAVNDHLKLTLFVPSQIDPRVKKMIVIQSYGHPLDSFRSSEIDQPVVFPLGDNFGL